MTFPIKYNYIILPVVWQGYLITNVWMFFNLLHNWLCHFLKVWCRIPSASLEYELLDSSPDATSQLTHFHFSILDYSLYCSIEFFYCNCLYIYINTKVELDIKHDFHKLTNSSAFLLTQSWNRILRLQKMTPTLV